MKTGEVRIFRNNFDAEQELGLYDGAVSGVVSGGRTTAGLRGGEAWWFTQDSKAKPPTEFGNRLVAKARSKAIIATNKKTGIEIYFESAKAAYQEIGVHRSTISTAIKKNKPASGYFFRFV